MKKIYLADPLGFSEACRGFYYGQLLPLVKESDFEVLDPWNTGIEIFAPRAEKQTWDRFNVLAGERNRKMIESSGDTPAILYGTHVDGATASETVYASALGKKILGYGGRISASRETRLKHRQPQDRVFHTKKRRQDSSLRRGTGRRSLGCFLRLRSAWASSGFV